MAVKIGSSALNKAYVGSTAVKKIYLGSSIIWTAFNGPQRGNSAFAASANGTASLTVNYPAGTQAGDLIIMQAGNGRSANATVSYSLSAPNWTWVATEDQSAAAGYLMAWFYWIAGSETSVTITPSVTTSWYNTVAQIVTYKSGTFDPLVPVYFPTGSGFDFTGVAFSQPASANTTALTSPATTTDVANCELLLMSAFYLKTATSGVSTAWGGVDGEIIDSNVVGASTAWNMSTAYADQASAGTTPTYTATPSAAAYAKTVAALVVNPVITGDRTVVFSTTGSGTFTVPTGVTSITAHCIGAGGSGGGSYVTFGSTSSAGGAGGNYARKAFSVTPGQSISLSVAAATAVGSGNGAAGASSWFSANSSSGCVATGGAGGGGSGTAASGSSSGSYGDVVYTGGSSASGSSHGGGGGGGAGTTGNGGAASSTTAGTGTSLYGGTGGAGRTSGGSGNAASNYGGGGGGAYNTGSFTTYNGGAGAQGVVVVEFTL